MKKLLLLALAACVDHHAPITGVQSLKIDLIAPTDTGSIDNRLPDTAHAISMNITAIDANDQPDTTYNNTLQVYVHYLGTLSPYLGDPNPFAVVQMSGGHGSLSTTLPAAVLGPTTLWFDDGTDPNATYATGVSPTLWYRDPFIVDIQTPASETGVGALDIAPLDNKNIAVNASRYGATGRLVITSVFSQGYTLADVNCKDANGTPPCTSQDYDYVEVFSYSAPLDQDKRFVAEGQLIDGFAGGVSEFDGLTEIGFPQTFVAGQPVIDTSREPLTVKFDPAWFGPCANPITGPCIINFERNEAGAIEIDNAKVCALDSDYTTFHQWKIDPLGNADAATCAGHNVINVISLAIGDLDPSTLVGKSVPRIVGMLRPINIGSFNVWIIYPRSMADFTLN